jgi:molybdenum cofactor cytidylyltransferase
VFVSAILLAAGESTRMGRQKALLPWQGTTLLQYQLEQFASVDHVREIIVVTGHEPERITEIAAAGARVRVAHNAAYRTGKVSSITTGLAAVSRDADAVLLLGVDQPRAATIVRAVIDRHVSAGATITVPTHRGHRGHPVLFDRALLPELRAISEDSMGVREVMRRHGAQIVEVELADPDVNLDLNRPEDVETPRA